MERNTLKTKKGKNRCGKIRKTRGRDAKKKKRITEKEKQK